MAWLVWASQDGWLGGTGAKRPLAGHADIHQVADRTTVLVSTRRGSDACVIRVDVTDTLPGDGRVPGRTGTPVLSALVRASPSLHRSAGHGCGEGRRSKHRSRTSEYRTTPANAVSRARRQKSGRRRPRSRGRRHARHRRSRHRRAFSDNGRRQPRDGPECRTSWPPSATSSACKGSPSSCARRRHRGPGCCRCRSCLVVDSRAGS